mgnify:CR=1 FL=1
MTPERKIGVLFKTAELKMVIGLLEGKEEECFTSDKKAEAEVYNNLAVQLESIYNKALEQPLEDSPHLPHQVGWVSPQDPGDENDQPLPKEEYIQSVQPHPSMPGPSPTVIDRMESDFPSTMKLFLEINNQQYELFAKKQADYGPGNISMNGNKSLALLGLGVRMNDKTQRILNITHNNKEPNNE